MQTNQMCRINITTMTDMKNIDDNLIYGFDTAIDKGKLIVWRVDYK